MITKTTKKKASKNIEKTIDALPYLKKKYGRLTLGRVISAIRQCDEIKQIDFAKKLGVSQSYLCDLENDRKEVSPKKAAEFARILEDSETQFVRLAIQDMLIRQGLHYTIELHKAA